MKRSTVQQMAFCSALAWLAVAAGTSSAQDLGPGEVVVDAQVLSDTAVDPAAELAAEAPGEGEGDYEGEYVGDLPAVPVGGAPAMRRGFGQPDLFYNYYTQGQANRVNAQLFLSPVPVPPHVGHTYFTYQPFYPDELLYWHKNRYHNYYDNGRGMNRTRAVYYSPPIRQALSNFYWNVLRIPR